MDIIATFRYDTVEVENGLKKLTASFHNQISRITAII